MLRTLPWILLAFSLGWLGLAAHPLAAEEKLLDSVAEKMHSGEWGPAEQQLRRRLADNPADDEARFALGFTQVIRTFERAAQFHYEYGAKFDQAAFLFPADFKPNPAPNRISYRAWRREMETLYDNLAAAESTFAVIRDKEVKFRIAAAKLQWDLNGDGKPQTWMPSEDQITAHMKELARHNAQLNIAFDYTDAIWFRGYCHLIMSTLDFLLAADLEPLFEGYASQGYENPRYSAQGEKRSSTERQEAAWQSIMKMPLVEPERWGLARRHLLQVTELSQQMWDAAEAETDDDFEWLPNPKQTGALRIKVDAQMIDAWRAAMREGHALLQGKKLIKFWWMSSSDFKEGKGINVRKLLDNPPETVPLFNWVLGGPKPYIEEGPLYDEAVFQRVDSVFRGNTLGFSLWFN